MNLLIAVGSFAAAFAAEYWHDRLSIGYYKLTNSSVPPWTRRAAQLRRMWRAMWRSALLSSLQWFDLTGIVKWHLPLAALWAGSTFGGMAACGASMWEDWKEARARYLGPTMLGRPRGSKRGSDVEQIVPSDPDQTNLLTEEE